MMKPIVDRKKLSSAGILIAVGALAVSTVVFAAGPGGGGPGGGSADMGQIEMSESVINVKLQTPTIGSLTRNTEFIGKIEANESVSVYPEVSGKVTAVYFDAGEQVQEGDLLFEIDDSDAQLAYDIAQASYESQVISAETTLGSSYDSSLLSAESSLKSAQQSLSNARGELRDYNDDTEDELIAAEKKLESIQAEMDTYESQLSEMDPDDPEYETVKSKLEAAEAEYTLQRANVNELEDTGDSELRSLRNAYKTAQTNYENALNQYNLLKGASLEDTQASVDNSLKSAELSLEQSAKTLEKYKIYAPISGVIETKSINALENASTQTAAYTISNKDTMVVKFNATADAATALNLNDTITLTKSGNEYTATIIEIDSKADDTSGLFPIKARIEDGDSSLLTGVTVKVTAATEKVEDAILIPIDVVYYEDGQAYVFTYSDGTAHRTDIETGMSDSETIAVTSGLTTDSQIITTWHPDLKDGASVNLAEGQEEPASSSEPSTEDADSQSEQPSDTSDLSSNPSSDTASGTSVVSDSQTNVDASSMEEQTEQSSSLAQTPVEEDAQDASTQEASVSQETESTTAQED